MRGAFVVLVDTGGVYETEFDTYFKEDLEEAMEAKNSFPDNRAEVFVRLKDIRRVLASADLDILSTGEFPCVKRPEKKELVER